MSASDDEQAAPFQEASYWQAAYIAFSLALSVLYLGITVATLHDRDKQINRLTLYPYISLLVMECLEALRAFIFVGISGTDELLYLAEQVIQFFYFYIILWQSFQWALITQLVKYQGRTPLNQLMVFRDEHFCKEREMCKKFKVMGGTILGFCFIIIVLACISNFSDLDQESRYGIHETILIIVIIQQGVLALIFFWSGISVALATRKYYLDIYYANKKRFSLVFTNMLVLLMVQLFSDCFTFKFELCHFHGEVDDCSQYLGYRLWKAPGYWIQSFIQKLPVLAFALFDSAEDVMSKFNRYPELTSRVSIFQFEDYHRHMERLYDEDGQKFNALESKKTSLFGFTRRNSMNERTSSWYKADQEIENQDIVDMLTCERASEGLQSSQSSHFTPEIQQQSQLCSSNQASEVVESSQDHQD